MRGLRLLAAIAALALAFAARAQSLALPVGSDLVGSPRTATVQADDTFSDIARRHDLGYQEMVNANPGVDPWLPPPGAEVILPTERVLPRAPRSGLVLNLPEMRLYHYPPARAGEAPVVHTHPVSIGDVDWTTPLGLTHVAAKTTQPTWFPPASIRAEHAADGDRLPGAVPPGPDNPLGDYALRLGIAGYLIHGTNKPYGIGMRVTHGCVRLYPEDIEALYRRVPVGTPVRIVNQPHKLGWRDGVLYLESHPPLETAKKGGGRNLTPLVGAVIETTRERAVEIDWEKAMRVAEEARGVPVAISAKLGPPRTARAAAGGR
jgi:L,D-transpeptidase ErfK/SrfK